MSTKLEQLKLARQKTESVIEETRKSAQITLPDDYDWHKWPLPVLAELLQRIPVRSSRDGGSVYLNREQAAIWAVVSFRTNTDPFLGENYFNEKTNRVNITFAGKMKMARELGYKLGAPRFERVTKPWPGLVARIKGLDEDIGYICHLPIGSDQEVSYTAWASEWFMPANPNWVNRLEHMLQVRSNEKALSFASGVGVSEDPDDRDIQPQKTVEQPVIEVTAPSEVKE